MNKKEFEEKYLDDSMGCRTLRGSFDNCWQWIEEQLRQARIDENEKALRYHDSLGAEEYFSGYYFENRIKELGE